MKFEERRTMSRGQLIDLLRRIADRLEGGFLDYTHGEVGVPEQLDVEVEYKEKDRKRKFELELKWEEGRSKEKKRMKVETEICEELPPAMDDAKGELKKLFRGIRLSLEGGNMPESGNVSRMLKLNAKFDEYSAGKLWHDEQRVFTERMAEFENAVKNGDLAGAQRLMTELRTRKKTCHRNYRWKE
jgi:XXXCH domain-containing protein